MLTSAPAVAAGNVDLDLASMFAGLDAAPALLLAVSGGPDSMALLHLAVRWSQSELGSPRLNVATVDHGLRSEAADEAALVASVAASFGVPHATLAWLGPKPVRGIQEKAREARYRLLAGHAQAVGAPFVLTAHHADDQAETVLMRLGRGSGVTGLAAMRRLTPLTCDVTLVRPLLALTKQDLTTICTLERSAFVTDPSNDDPAYGRVRLRQQRDTAAALGLDRPALLRLAGRMARADEALEAEVGRKLLELQPRVEPGLWTADLAGAYQASPEIFQRLIGRAALQIGEAKHLPLASLEKVAIALRAALDARRIFRGTLGGVLLALDDHGTLTVTPEPARRRGRSRPD